MASQLADDLRRLELEGFSKPPTPAELSELRWETRQAVFLNLFSEIPNTDAGSVLMGLVSKRRQGRKEERAREKAGRPEDLGLLPEHTRKEEDAFRVAFMDTVANELRNLSAPRGICNTKLLMKDKTQCLSAMNFLVHKAKSRAKAHAGFLQRLSTSSPAGVPSSRGAAAGALSPSSSAASAATSLINRPIPRLHSSKTRPVAMMNGGPAAGRKRGLPTSLSATTASRLEDRPAWVSPLGQRADDAYYDDDARATWMDSSTDDGGFAGDGESHGNTNGISSNSRSSSPLQNGGAPLQPSSPTTTRPEHDNEEDGEEKTTTGSSSTNVLPCISTSPSRAKHSLSTVKEESSASNKEGSLASTRTGAFHAGAGSIEISCSARPSRRATTTARKGTTTASASSPLTTSSLSSSSTGIPPASSASISTATAFYCNQLTNLEEEVQHLKTENSRLKSEVQRSQALYDALAQGGGGAGGSASALPTLDERRLFMLQSQNLQLQRQVLVLTEATNGQEDLSSHMSALLSILEANVEEVVKIGKEGIGRGSTIDGLSPARTVSGRRPPPLSIPSKNVGQPLKIGSEFWSSVLDEIRHLNQNRIHIQKASRAAHISRIMLPSDAKICLVKPRHASSTTSPSSSAAAEQQQRTLNGEMEDRQSLKQVGLKENGNGSSTPVLAGLSAQRLQDFAKDLQALLTGLEGFSEILLKDPSILAHRAGLLQPSIGGNGGGDGDIETMVGTVLDQSRALMLDAASLGLVLPVTASHPVINEKERELLEHFAVLCSPAGMKPSEIAREAFALKALVLAERRALAKSLATAMEEVVVWRFKGVRHRALIHKLSEGLGELWRCQEEEVGRAAEALEDVLGSLEIVEANDEAPRVTRGQMGNGLARLLQGLFEYRGELEKLYDVCCTGGGRREGKRSGDGGSCHIRQLRGRLTKLWTQYQRAWDALGDEEGQEARETVNGSSLTAYSLDSSNLSRLEEREPEHFKF